MKKITLNSFALRKYGEYYSSLPPYKQKIVRDNVKDLRKGLKALGRQNREMLKIQWKKG